MTLHSYTVTITVTVVNPAGSMTSPPITRSTEHEVHCNLPTYGMTTTSTGSHWDGHVVMMYSPSDSDTEGWSGSGGAGGAGGAVGGVFAVIAAILVVEVIVLVVWWVRRRLVTHDVMTCCCTRDDGCLLQ